MVRRATTTLTGEIMKAHFGKDKTFVVGNIGNPYTLEADKTSKDSVTVGEISSFQLETIHTFHPVVSAILNITPDHLNRHHTMEAYVAAKEAVASHQTKNDICVLNYDNDYTRDFAGRCPATPVLFSSHHELENGYFLRGDKIIKSVNGEETELNGYSQGYESGRPVQCGKCYGSHCHRRGYAGTHGDDSYGDPRFPRSGAQN